MRMNELTNTSFFAYWLNQIAQVFEKMFNCSFGSIYDRQEQVFIRKPFAKALDFLRRLIIRKDKEGLNKQDEK